jgi:hypothetical protein
MELITKLEETIGPVGIMFVILLVNTVITAIVVAIILGVSEPKRYSDYKKYEREKERERRYYGDDEGYGAHFW